MKFFSLILALVSVLIVGCLDDGSTHENIRVESSIDEAHPDPIIDSLEVMADGTQLPVKELPFKIEDVKTHTDQITGFTFLMISGYDVIRAGSKEPMLPYRYLTVELPANAHVESIELLATSKEIFTDVTLPGFQEALPIQGGEPGVAVPLADMDRIYPTLAVEYELQRLDSVSMLHLTVCPAVYDAMSRELTVVTSGSWRISYSLR